MAEKPDPAAKPATESGQQMTVMLSTLKEAQDTVRIALVVKALGIGFFEAAAKGAEEAAAELGNVEIIYTGPTDTTAVWVRIKVSMMGGHGNVRPLHQET